VLTHEKSPDAKAANSSGREFDPSLFGVPAIRWGFAHEDMDMGGGMTAPRRP
jgi:hypothetical protein